HLFEFFRGRRAVVVADDVGAHLRRAYEGRDVEARALAFEPREVFAERAPVNVEVVAPVESLVLFYQTVVDGRDGAALARDFGRHSHHHLAHRARVYEDVLLRLTQHVYEAGRDDEPARINRASRAKEPARAPDETDAASLDTNV